MAQKKPSPTIPLNSPATVLATAFGLGRLPFAPGTWGTLPAIPLFVLLQGYGWWIYSAAVIAIIVAGVWICGQAARECGVHDHGGIVWDEIAGYLVTMLFIPVSPTTVVLGFLLFRLFDIVKPWPIKFLDERIHGGAGIMLDDIVAGLFANLCLWIILVYIAPSVPILF